ncbi:MAG: hypothetical protein AUI36_34130 [Cyanobacteria bacterium 13_1_40CM_2_61_4]|nr:MAG: hypothetical protein AUI36_34130 [Cyanobacteria bacterium 13_1_40CM_2_61_4]
MTRRPSWSYFVLALIVPTALAAEGGSGPPASRRSAPPSLPVNLATDEATRPLFPGPVFQVGPRPIGMVAGDFNADGHPDLVTLDAGVPPSSGDLSLLLGSGDGTFQARVVITVGSSPFALISADFNADGQIDLAVGDTGATGQPEALVLLGNPDGTFAQLPPVAAESTAVGFATADFNSDGHIDLATAAKCEDTAFCGHGDIAVYMGAGNGTFSAPSKYSVGERPIAVVAGDFSGDGVIDLISINTCANQYSCSHDDLTLLAGQGDGTFVRPSFGPIGVGRYPTCVVAADFNSDGRLDLAVLVGDPKQFTILLGSQGGGFSYGAPVRGPSDREFGI